MAHQLVRDDPAGAQAVKDGADLRKAHSDLQDRLGEADNERSRRQKLRHARPDLADRVTREELALEDAERIAQAEAAELKAQRWAATVNLVETVMLADRPAEPQETIELFDRDVEKQKGEAPITAERLRNAVDYLSGLADLWEDPP
jgi:hypothetical protein